jgi:SAM-dependent methyltransferase
MDWRISQTESRNRYLAKFDEAEAASYDAVVGELTRQDQDAYLSDLAPIVQFREGMKILDAGAGTGTLCQILSRVPERLSITALEPVPAMLARLRNKPELDAVTTVEGFCDASSDRRHFQSGQFDVIISRQLVNGLFDPLAAFRNWHYWSAPLGKLVVIDGIYGRAAWTGVWEEEIDALPLSACQSTALVPYLLEIAGFRIDAVRWMEATNRQPSTRTKRYAVVATRVTD